MHLSFFDPLQLLIQFGYLVVFIFVTIESIGIPVPGETILLIAAIYAGTTHHLSIIPIIICAASGAIIGDNVGYWIGKKGGYCLLRRYGHIIHFNHRKLKLGQYLFIRYGGYIVFFGRFIPTLRIWAAFLAGVNHMPRSRFLLFNALGGCLWATLNGVGGYILGNNIYRLTGPTEATIALFAVIITIASLLLLRRYEQQLTDKAEQALPDPLD